MPTALLALLLTVLSQATSPFVGSWAADFKGTTYVRLNIQVVDGRFVGTINTPGSLKVDPSGELESVTAASTMSSPLLDLHLADSVLSFSSKDGDDRDQFELRLTGDKTAELSLILDEESRQELASGGIPPPRPFRLRKIE
jgi:hypothetical protein